MEKAKKCLKLVALLPLIFISCVLAVMGKILLAVAFLVMGDADGAKKELSA